MNSFLLYILGEAATVANNGATLTEVYVIAGASIGVFLAIMRAVEYFINKSNGKDDSGEPCIMRLQSEACKYDHKQLIDSLSRIEHSQERYMQLLDQVVSNMKDLTYLIKELKEDLKDERRNK